MGKTKKQKTNTLESLLKNLDNLDDKFKLSLLARHHELIENITHLALLCEHLSAELLEKAVFNQLNYWDNTKSIDYADVLGGNEEAFIFYDYNGDIHSCTPMFCHYIDVTDAIYNSYEDSNEAQIATIDFIKATTDAIASSPALLHMLTEISDILDSPEYALQLAEEKIHLIRTPTDLIHAVKAIDPNDRLDLILQVEARWNMREVRESLNYPDLFALCDLVDKKDVLPLLNTHQDLLNTGAKAAEAMRKLSNVNECAELLNKLKSNWEVRATHKANKKRDKEATANQRPHKRAKASKSVMFAVAPALPNPPEQEPRMQLRSGKKLW